MRSHNGILALAAAVASLLLHAAVLSSFRSIKLHAGFGDVPVEHYEEMTVVFDPTDRANDPANEFPVGEVGAKGYASHKTPGDRTALAREAPVDQAALSLDPVGPEPRPETPSPDAGTSSADTSAPPILLPPPRVLVAKLQPLVESIPARLAALLPAPDMPNQGAVEMPPPFEVVAMAPEVDVPAPPSTAPAPPPGASPPGHADPAPLSDSESDAFSVLGSATFVNGELRVRAGRKIRSRRPKIGLAGKVDSYLSRPEVTLRVSTDAAGNVTNVEVVKSSGSNEIDQPCRVSMYDWWFEPKKDAAGKPVPDVFNFTIGFH